MRIDAEAAGAQHCEMKLDIELARTILLNAEAGKYQHGAMVAVDGKASEDCAYQLSLMIDSNLVTGEIIRTSSCPYAAGRIERITSQGHDFLAEIKKSETWQKALDGPIKDGCGLGKLIAWTKDQSRH